jgi:hypothetical protein
VAKGSNFLYVLDVKVAKGINECFGHLQFEVVR